MSNARTELLPDDTDARRIQTYGRGGLLLGFCRPPKLRVVVVTKGTKTIISRKIGREIRRLLMHRFPDGLSLDLFRDDSLCRLNSKSGVINSRQGLRNVQALKRSVTEETALVLCVLLFDGCGD